MSDTPLAIVDIDGVLADVRHRVHHVRRYPKDWNAFFMAAPHDPAHRQGLDVVAELGDHHEVVFLTGRPEWCRADTVEWLERHGLGGHRLVMRPHGDRRPAAVLKVELLARLSSGRRVALVVDDDPMVIAAMERAGHATRHADWERRDRDEAAALLAAQEEEGRS